MTEVTAKSKLTQTKSIFPSLFSHRWFAKWPGEDGAHAGRVQLRLTAPELISATPFLSPAKHIKGNDTVVLWLHNAGVSAPNSRPGQAGLYLTYESPSSFSHHRYDFISLLTTDKKLIPIATLLGQWKFNISWLETPICIAQAHHEQLTRAASSNRAGSLSLTAAPWAPGLGLSAEKEMLRNNMKNQSNRRGEGDNIL